MTGHVASWIITRSLARAASSVITHTIRDYTQAFPLTPARKHSFVGGFVKSDARDRDNRFGAVGRFYCVILCEAALKTPRRTRGSHSLTDLCSPVGHDEPAASLCTFNSASTESVYAHGMLSSGLRSRSPSWRCNPYLKEAMLHYGCNDFSIPHVNVVLFINTCISAHIIDDIKSCTWISRLLQFLFTKDFSVLKINVSQNGQQ